MKLLAYDLSKISHSGQLYGKEDYFLYHIVPIENIVHQKYFKDQYSIVAYLHDIVEDTDVTLKDINSLFGGAISNSVDAITRRKNEPWLDYLNRVVLDDVAKAVKYYDVQFNLEETINQITMTKDKNNIRRYKKYMQALRVLHP